MVPPRPPRVPSGAEPAFRASGHLWLGVREFVEDRVNGGTPAVVQHLDAKAAALFTRPFVPTGWYDILPMVAVASGIARALGVSVVDYQRIAAVWQAERDLSGPHGDVLRASSPESVCRRFASIYAVSYDFGRVEVVSVEGQNVHATASGLPEPIAEWWMRASEAYTRYVLFAAGAHNPRLVWETPEPDGKRAGVPLVRIRSTTSWD